MPPGRAGGSTSRGKLDVGRLAVSFAGGAATYGAVAAIPTAGVAVLARGAATAALFAEGNRATRAMLGQSTSAFQYLAEATLGGVLGSLPQAASLNSRGPSSMASGQLLPERLARVVPAEFSQTPMLGPPGHADVFVTALEDLAGAKSGTDIARRLTLLDSNGELLRGSRAVISFDNPLSSLASPVLRDNPGFIGGGRTADGAREFVLRNQSSRI